MTVRTATMLGRRIGSQVIGRRHASSGGQQYNTPTGRLFNEPPLKPGQKRVKEDWENIWYWGMGISIAIAVVGKWNKPNLSFNEWAELQAKKKMEENGELPTYEKS